MGVIDEGQRFSISVPVQIVGGPATTYVVLRQGDALEVQDLTGHLYFADLQMEDPAAGTGPMDTIELLWIEQDATEHTITVRDADYTASGMRFAAPAVNCNLVGRFYLLTGNADGRIIVSGSYL